MLVTIGSSRGCGTYAVMSVDVPVMSEPRFPFETPDPSSVAAKSLVPAATDVPDRS
jgi:hypothetical protein